MEAVQNVENKERFIDVARDKLKDKEKLIHGAAKLQRITNGIQGGLVTGVLVYFGFDAQTAENLADKITFIYNAPVNALENGYKKFINNEKLDEKELAEGTKVLATQAIGAIQGVAEAAATIEGGRTR